MKTRYVVWKRESICIYICMHIYIYVCMSYIEVQMGFMERHVSSVILYDFVLGRCDLTSQELQDPACVLCSSFLLLLSSPSPSSLPPTPPPLLFFSSSYPPSLVLWTTTDQQALLSKSKHNYVSPHPGRSSN